MIFGLTISSFMMKEVYLIYFFIFFVVLFALYVFYKNQKLNELLRSEIQAKYEVTSALQREIANNKALLSAAGDAIHVLNLDGNVVLANESFCKHLGCHSSEVMGLNVMDWDVKWSAEQLIRHIPELRGKVSTFETLHRRFSGEIVPVEINSVGVDIEGEPLLFCSARDISLRKAHERELTKAASVFHHSHEGIFILDSKWYLIDSNQSFSQITGISKVELESNPPLVDEIITPTVGTFGVIKEDLKRKDVWKGEIQNVSSNQVAYIAKLTISKVKKEHDLDDCFIGVMTDITQNKQYQAKLEKLAHYDSLTGLPNKVLLEKKLNNEIVQASQKNSNIAVLYIDLDGFKNINDTFGHAVGDQFLVKISNAISVLLRESDLLARVGGDEFVAILSGYRDLISVEKTVKRLLEAASTSICIGDIELQASASIGVSHFRKGNETLYELIHLADMAMYEAKKAGKNTFR